MTNNIVSLPNGLAAPTLNQTNRPESNQSAWSDAVSVALARPATTKASSSTNRLPPGKASPQAAQAKPITKLPGSPKNPLTTPALDAAPPVPEADREAPDADLAPPNVATTAKASPDLTGQEFVSRSPLSPVRQGIGDPPVHATAASKSGPVDQAAVSNGQAVQSGNGPAKPPLQPDVKFQDAASAGISKSYQGESHKIKSAGPTSVQSPASPASMPVAPVTDPTGNAPITVKADEQSAPGASSVIGTAGMESRPSPIQVTPTKGNTSDQAVPDIAPGSRSRITAPVNTVTANSFLPLQVGPAATPSSSSVALGTTPSMSSQAGLANTLQELAATGGGTARVTLSPASLGNVVIDVLVSPHGSVSIRMVAETGQGRKALGDSISGLNRHMTEAGFTVGSVQVVQQLHDGSNILFNANTPGQGGYAGQNNSQTPGGSPQGRQQQGSGDAPVTTNRIATDAANETTVSTSGPQRSNDGISAYA